MSLKKIKKTNTIKRMKKDMQHFPVILEKDEDGVYVIECPVFKGCYSEGKTIKEALKNIREVISLCLEEKENKKVARSYHPTEVSLHTVFA